MSFADFFLATREKMARDPSKLINQSSKYRNYFWPKMLRGLSTKQLFRAGTKLQDRIRLSIQNNFQFYSPTGEFSFTSSNGLVSMEMNWRCWLTYMTWTDHELVLNSGESEKEKYKDLRRVKELELEQGFWEGAEDALWATPNAATMESGHILEPGAVAGQTYSLRAFVTKDGLAPSSTNGGVDGADWTTVMGITVSAQTNWRNQVEQYDSANFEQDILDHCDLMWLKVQWEAPESATQYMEETRLNKLVIPASMTGYSKLLKLARMSNNTLSPKGNFSEMQGKLTYNGIPIRHVSALDTVDATDDAAGKPNYRFMNMNGIRPVLHSQRNRYAIQPAVTANQPFQHLHIEDTWGNIWCENRRELGFVSAA